MTREELAHHESAHAVVSEKEQLETLYKGLSDLQALANNSMVNAKKQGMDDAWAVLAYFEGEMRRLLNQADERANPGTGKLRNRAIN